MEASKSVAYRARYGVFVGIGILQALIYPFIWSAALQGGEANGFGESQIFTYYILFYLVTYFIQSFDSMHIAAQIRNGDISKHLAQPIEYLPYINLRGFFGSWMTQIVGFPIILGVIFLAREIFIFPQSVSTWVYLLVSIPLSAVMAIQLSNVLGLIAFWIEDIRGIMNFNFVGVTVFGGMLAPLALLPDVLQMVAKWLPYRYLGAFHLEVYLERLTYSDLVSGMGVLVAWTVGLFLLSRFLWSAGTKRYGAVGA